MFLEFNKAPTAYVDESREGDDILLNEYSVFGDTERDAAIQVREQGIWGATL